MPGGDTSTSRIVTCSVTTPSSSPTVCIARVCPRSWETTVPSSKVHSTCSVRRLPAYQS